MADIRNDQFLHRPGAGRGAVTPSDPLEARLFGSNGQPISVTSDKLDVRATELEALIGEVRESPSAHTLLARLKTLADTLGTEATLQAVKIALDSLNAKDYATQATLAEVLSRLEAIEQRLAIGEAQVTLTGKTVEIGAKQFVVVKGERIVGKAADRPSASDAAAVLFDGVFYHAHDTGDVWQASDGDWRHLGVA